MDDSKYIADLVTDAKLVAEYGMQAGLLSDASLYQAIAAVESTAATDRKSPEVLKLHEEMAKAMKLIPFSTLRALRRGWRPGSGDSPALLVFLLIASLVFMILAVKLTAIYNTGVELVDEIRTVASTDPEHRFGQLSRQLIAARQKLTVDGSASPKPEDESLKVQSYFETFDLLRDLDQQLNSIETRVMAFEETASYPVVFSYPVWSVVYNIEAWTGYLDSDARKHVLRKLQQQSNYLSQQQDNGTLDRAVASIASFFRRKDDAKRGQPVGGCQQYVDFASQIDRQIKYIDENFPASRNFANIIKEYLDSSLYMTCFERITYTPYFVPRIEDSEIRVRRAIQPYASYILPAIFGAIGAIIYHIRIMLDPLKENIRTFRVFHRVVGGAVAGIMIAWLISSDSKVVDQFSEVGFGVFALCFIVGFSLDVFFEILERLVNLSKSAVGQIGMK